MKNEFVMRGQTASTAGLNTETLNFGVKDGYAYRLVEFKLYPSSNLGTAANEMCATLTAGKTAIQPDEPNFNDEGLIGTSAFSSQSNNTSNLTHMSVINDTFLITQNLILMVLETGGNAYPVNWQCRFVAEKLSENQKANQNYRQFMIFDE